MHHTDTTETTDLRAAIPRDRLLRMPEVERLTGLRKTLIYDLAKRGEFPKSIRLHSRAVAWSEVAVLSWIQARIAESQQ